MSTMRIAGLASGMDINQIVSDMVRADRVPVDKMIQKRQQLEWQRDSYREVNNLLRQFDTMIFDGVIRSSKMAAKTVSSSNSNKVTATATAAAKNATYTLSEVTQLASAASTFSRNSIGLSGAKLDPKKTFSEQPTIFNETLFDKSTGTGIMESINVTTSKDTFNLSKLQGGSVDTVTSVLVGTDSYQIYRDRTAYDSATDTNKVFISDAGNLLFNKQLESGANIDVNYTAVQKDRLSVTSSNTGTEFKLNKSFVDTVKNNTIKVLGPTPSDGGPRPSKDYTIVTDQAAFDSSTNTNEVFLDKKTGKLTFKESIISGSTIEADYHHHYGEFNIKTHTSTGEKTQSFSFNGSDTMNGVMTKINNSTVGLNAFYDEFSDKVTMTRTESGDFKKDGYEIEMSGVFLTDVLKFGTPSTNPLADPATDLTIYQEQGGKNALFTINGLETERNSNTFSLNGVTFTLNGTVKAADGDSPVIMSINTNTDETFKTIKEFVDKYNELIEKVNSKLKEEKYRTYLPLTSEQKESLSEKEIEKWEEKAKSGLLRNDSLLSSVVGQMRLQIYSAVTSDSEYKQLSSIGITTTNKYNEGGKLEINEAKLKAAIEADPEGVHKLFSADGPTTADKGIARRMRDVLSKTMKDIGERAGGVLGKSTNEQFTIGRSIKSLDSRISSLESRLKQKEDRYWKQFTALEKTMQQANSQASYLYQQLGMTAPQ